MQAALSASPMRSSERRSFTDSADGSNTSICRDVNENLVKTRYLFPGMLISTDSHSIKSPVDPKLCSISTRSSCAQRHFSRVDAYTACNARKRRRDAKSRQRRPRHRFHSWSLISRHLLIIGAISSSHFFAASCRQLWKFATKSPSW